jgi:hypothetical protein
MRLRQRPTRCKDFANGNHGEDAKETSKAHLDFTAHGKPPVREQSASITGLILADEKDTMGDLHEYLANCEKMA